MGKGCLGLPAPSVLGKGGRVHHPLTSILSTAVLFPWVCSCYLGERSVIWGVGREAAAYFTGQDGVKNKTTANSTPRVLQGLSMTPSFPLSPQPGSTSPEAPPHPAPQVQWLLAFMQTTV